MAKLDRRRFVVVWRGDKLDIGSDNTLTRAADVEHSTTNDHSLSSEARTM